MIYNELTMEERQNDLWKRNDDEQLYVVIMMYSVNDTSEPRFIASQSMKWETAVKKLEAMLNAWEQERAVCLNSHFVNPKNIIMIRLDLWKERTKGRQTVFDGEFYE